jgi:hypothetical protein
MPELTPCTPEGGLEALAEALFTHHRLEIPCEGEGEHVPLNKDKAGRKDINGRLYRYWTCTRCHPSADEEELSLLYQRGFKGSRP